MHRPLSLRPCRRPLIQEGTTYPTVQCPRILLLSYRVAAMYCAFLRPSIIGVDNQQQFDEVIKLVAGMHRQLKCEHVSITESRVFVCVGGCGGETVRTGGVTPRVPCATPPRPWPHLLAQGSQTLTIVTEGAGRNDAPALTPMRKRI